MKALSINAKYLAVVNSDDVNPDGVRDKLEEAGITAFVLGIPNAPSGIELYQIKGYIVTTEP